MADGLYILDGLGCGDCIDCDCLGWLPTVPDDGGFVDVGQLRRALNAKKFTDYDSAQAIYAKGAAAAVMAGTSAARKVGEQLYTEWESIKAQPGPVYDISRLSDYVVQAVIELNAVHAGDLSWAHEKALWLDDLGNIIENAPALFLDKAGSAVAAVTDKAGNVLATVTERVAESAANIGGATAEGFLGALLNHPIGLAALGVGLFFVLRGRR